MKQLTTPRMEQCIGCHSCSLACARLVYSSLSWNTAGIRIHTAGGLSTGFLAVTCLACLPAPCAAVCPTGALRGRPGGGVRYRRELCIQCGECLPACPVAAISADRQGHIYLCIHCGQCVRFCPQDCLEMVDTEPGEDR
jgi:Fe-S-cluster-containing hydrogenase component 2